MEKPDAQAFGYNLDRITGEALRRKEALDTATRLDTIFRDGTSFPAPYTALLARVPKMVECHLNGVFTLRNNSATVSAPYDALTHEGVELESRVLRIHIAGPESGETSGEYMGGDLYLLCLAGVSQLEMTRDNFIYGVAKTVRQEIMYFAYTGNEMRDAMVNVARHVEPVEQARVVSEFQKALTVLGDK